MTPRTCPGRRLRPLLAAVLVLGVAGRLLGAEGGVALAWQDNVTNTTSDGGRLSAWMVTAQTSGALRRPLSPGDALYFGAQAAGEACLTYPRLDSLTAGPRLAVVHKFGLGAFAPLLRLEVGGAGIAARQSFRSGWNGRAALTGSRRFTDSLQMVVDGAWSDTEARDRVFSGHTAGGSASLVYDLTERWRLRVRLGWRNGAVVSYYRSYWWRGAWQPAGDGYDTAAYDPGPGREVDTFDQPYLAYRLRAHTWSEAVTLSPALGPDTALVFSCEFFQTANAAVRYVNRVLSAGLAHRF